MKHRYLLLLSALISLSVFAQDGELQGLINTDNFPNVSFVWHEYNPEPISASFFDLKEDGISVDATVKRIPSDQNEKGRAKAVVVLWEDMYCNGNMFEFSQRVLLNFIDSIKIVKGKDNIYVAAFNRHQNSEKVLRPITEGFVSSSSQLHQDICNYQRSTTIYSELPNQSDVYPAILEALELLQARDKDEVKGVFVISAGRPLQSSATNSSVEVQKRAKEMHIPLYMYQYVAAHGKSTVLEGLGNDTYGNSAIFEGGTSLFSILYATTCLSVDYRELPTHYNGQDYTISYPSNLQRGGKEVMLELKVKNQTYTFAFKPAKHTFWTWCKAYWYVCVLLLLALIAFVVWMVMYVQKQKALRAADAAALGQLKDEQAQSQQKMQEQLNEQAAKIEQYKAQETARRTSERKADSVSRLELMQKKNVFPRIQYSDNNNKMYVYEMHKPEILIGRSAEADIRLDDTTVSRKHAQISFTEGGFEIKDLGSSNGTIVSGRPIQGSALLNDHDIINMGNALLTFYL